MKVLVVTGDRLFKPGHPRYDLQATAVDRLGVLYWGPGSLWPKIPEGEFDVVTSQDPFFRGLVSIFLARKLKAKLNVQLHADLDAQSLFKKLIAWFVLPRADSVRVVSKALKKKLEKREIQNITVLPVYIELERFINLERTPSIEPLLLWIGRFEDEKDPLYAISVFRKVLKEVPYAKLIMLGKGSLDIQLKAEASELPIEFPGWQDVVPYLKKAHVVLSTSRAESYGASIIEALAAGVPVVAPDVGIAKEAGAIVVSKDKLAEAVVASLKEQKSGTLLFTISSAEQWVHIWKKSL